jgi:hypothetical protein
MEIVDRNSPDYDKDRVTPLRHKISSGFVRPQADVKLVPALIDFILGGAAFDEPLPASYAFRDRRVLLQFQA